MTIPPKRRWFQFSLRSLLMVMTVAAVLAGRITYLRRMAEFHQAEATRLRDHQNFLNSVSFDVPAEEWFRLDAMEIRHAGLAREYQQASWRPWRIVRESTPISPKPLPLRSQP